MNIRFTDMLFMILLIIGGLNWGLVGFFNFDLVGAILGPGSWLARIVYALVGCAAIYVVSRKAPQYLQMHHHHPKPC